MAIARSLINRLALVLADEPTASYRARVPGRGDADQPGPRAKPGRHHGDPRPAHGAIRRPDHPPAGRAAGTDRQPRRRPLVPGRPGRMPLDHAGRAGDRRERGEIRF
ncbi:MAG TPA: hypothetical protein ENN19_10345 [Chloroflexi bacterium]|nr:hypothetical protein [Chloroflexota bacterium]